MAKCPTCGSAHSSVKNMKIHHHHAHGESIAGVSVNCYSCGNEMRVRPYRAEKYDHHTCSDGCQRDLISDLKSGEHNKLLLECENCGDEVKKWPSQVHDSVYCNRECARDDGAHIIRGEDHGKFNQIPIQCSVCGEGFTREPSRLSRYDVCYCSQECAEKGHSDRISGENNPNYKHGKSDTIRYGPNWETTREEVLARDGEQCVVCDLTKEAQIEKWGCGLHIHHIIPLSEFDTTEEANTLDNLITVCQRCHGLIEQNQIGLEMVGGAKEDA